MRFASRLIQASFLRRLNRFALEADLEGRAVQAHLANSGRLGEILRPGALLYLSPRPASHRKTAYDVALARKGRTLISVDARLPNHLVAEAIEAGKLREFQGYESFKREVAESGSRLDFAFTGSEGRRCLVEVKSVTLVERGVALFPDAPTERGARHLDVLGRAASSGRTEALALFIVQRADARRFSPNREADPRFLEALRRAASCGVKVAAYTCRVTTRGVALHEEIEVNFKG